jgi:hypothetical protein
MKGYLKIATLALMIVAFPTEVWPADPVGYQMYSSISALKTGVASLPANTAETAHKVGLKNINLDSNNGWSSLADAINGSKFLDLHLQECSSQAIPDGRMESHWEGSKLVVTYYGTFAGFGNLAAITLPEGIKIIGENAFYKCDNLRLVASTDALAEIHKCAFRFCTALESFSLPGSLISIGDYGFESSGLRSIDVPGAVKTLGLRPFYDCTSLLSVTLNQGVETIGEQAFMGCSKLETVNLPDGLKTMISDAFFGCRALKTITLPASITSIGNSAFYDCKELDEVVMLPLNPPVLGTQAFHTIYTGPPGSFRIKVPPSSLEAYKTAGRWSAYADHIIANPTGFTPPEKGLLRIYPNPVADYFCVEGVEGLDLGVPVPLVLTDLRGQILLRRTVRNGESISLKHFPKGIYLVRVNGETVKVMKE